MTDSTTETIVGPSMRKCNTCGEVKSFAEFYVCSGYRIWKCKPCSIAESKRRQAAKREELGDDEWKRRKRAATTASRQRREYSTERTYNKAKMIAHQRLAQMYPKAFARLLDEELRKARNA